MAKTIKIGQASISENGTAHGNAGDSTGKEVYIINSYNISNIDPYIVLRPKTNAIANASVNACIAGCNNDNIGYSQTGRNTLYTSAKELNFDLSGVGPCNTDCSAFMTVCAIAGGARITYGSNAPTTSNMRIRFSQSGDYEVLTDIKYTTMTDYLKAGDILVHENIHTVMVLENGSAAHSEVNETEVSHSLQTYNVLPSTTNITNTSVIINIKTVKQVNELETTATAKNWTYVLEYKKLPDGIFTEQTVTENKATITNLNENGFYLYRVKVKNKNTGKDLFCSAYKTFNTLGNIKNVSTTTVVNDSYINAAYIKTDNSYTPVITHLNK